MEETKSDFYYECDRCKKLIEAYRSNPSLGIEAVLEKKNTYVFHCYDCVDGSVAQR